MTLPAIALARRALFVVTGASKRAALAAVRNGSEPLLPSARVRAKEMVLWIVDRATVGAEPSSDR